jgi:hypothetical protein
MENTVLVGFGYRARNGKDTAVSAIIEARSGQYDVRRYAFADVLKKEVNDAAVDAGGMLELFKQGGVRGPNARGLLHDDFVMFPSWVIYDADADMSDPLCPLGKQRTLLQWWGTDYRRNEDPNYWVEKLQEVIEKDKPAIALISDMRFPNEVSWVKSSIDNCVVRVDRLGYRSITPSHASETALDFMGDEDWHYILQVPDGDLEELKRDAVVVFDLIISSLTPPDLSDVARVEDGELKVPTASV